MQPQIIARLTSIAVVSNLVVQILIIGTGGAVRLTGSGLGCSTWPNCEPGQFTPSFHGATSIHPYVEFGNRVLGAVVVLVALLLLVLVQLSRTSGVRPAPEAPYRRLAALPLALSVLQAVLGGMTVRFELHPALVGSHFLISAVLVWISAWLVARWFRPVRRAPVLGAGARRLGWAMAAVAGVVVILGMIVTGSGPHSGDAEVGYRFAVDPVAVARLHAASVWVFLALLVVFAVVAHRSGSRAPASRLRRHVWVLLAVTLAQGAIGYVQYFSGLPELLVGMHMIGAALLVAATAFTLASMHERDPRAVLRDEPAAA